MKKIRRHNTIEVPRRTAQGVSAGGRVRLEDQGSLGAGFDSAMLEVFVNSVLAYQKSLTSHGDAQTFFSDNPIELGFQPSGPEDAQVAFDLADSQISSGFQYDYAFRDPSQSWSRRKRQKSKLKHKRILRATAWLRAIVLV
jgi:hypothetical protein